MMINDPLNWMREGDKSGSFERDPKRPKYELYVTKEEAEAEALVNWLVPSIEEAEEADQRRQRRILDNRKVYEGEPEKDQIMQIPIAKQDANQITAGLTNAILTKLPVVSVKPLEEGTLEVVVRSAQGEEPKQVSTVEYAKALQQYITYLIKRRVPFRRVFSATIRDMVSGGMPYIKVCYELKSRVVKEERFEKGDVAGEVRVEEIERETELDEPLRLVVVDGVNILMPPGERDEQTAEWFAEKVEWSPTRIREAFDNGTFYGDISDPKAKVDPELIEKIINSSAPDLWEQAKRSTARLVGRELKKRMNPVIHEVWFFWPTKDEDGKVKILHLCAQLHKETRTILSIYRAHYNHGLRPYTPFLQRPHSYLWASGSTVEDLGIVQRLMSKLFHITIKNGIQSITKAYKVKEGSPAWASMLKLEKQGGLKPGGIIGVGTMDEVEPFQTGGSLGSLSQEIGFLDTQRRELSVVPEHKNIPNRTAAGTVSQIMQETKAQGAETLENVREQLEKVFKMLVQTAQQFSDYGETVPFEDPKTKAITEEILYFPTKLLDDQFAFDITATSDEDTITAKKEAAMQDLEMINQNNDIVMEKVFEMLNAETPDFISEVYKQSIVRSEGALQKLLGLTNKDSNLFTWDEAELDAMLTAKREFLEQQKAEQEAAAQQQQEGAPNGQQPAAGPQAVPPQGQPPLGGPPGAAAQPGMAGPPAGPPPELLAALAAQGQGGPPIG